MHVHLKQSGELLGNNDQPGQLWTPDGVRSSAEKIQQAYSKKDKLNIYGLQIISGAGNVARGNQLAEHEIGGPYKDVIGRLATIQNTIVLAEALQRRNVPVKVFIADTMQFRDASMATMPIDTYDIDAALEAYEKERVVLIAGGTGEDGKTTDNAVLEYASRHRTARPSDDVLVLKGTKHDGVYEDDPKIKMNARRYSRIGAQTMLDEYERFSVVDRDCLEQIVKTGIAMRIFRDGQHDLESVVGVENGHIGTLVVGESIDPVFA